MAKKIPQVWLDWILENVSLGVDLDDIYYTLVQNGFDKNQIDTVLNNYKPKKKLDDSLLDKDKIINAESADTGRWKIATESPDAVIWSIKGWCDKAEEIINAASVAGTSSIMPHVKLSQKLSPYPLLGVISPWNFPFLLSS